MTVVLLGFGLTAAKGTASSGHGGGAKGCDSDEAQAIVIEKYKTWLVGVHGTLTSNRGITYRFNKPAVLYKFYGYFEGQMRTDPGAPPSPFSQVILGEVSEDCKLVKFEGVGGLRPL